MLHRMRTLLPLLAIGLSAPLMAACGGDGTTGPVIQNPATITVENELTGPVLFFFVKPCNTSDWGQDLLPQDPVEGTIQPGASKDFTVEAGCYDMQAQSLPSLGESSTLITDEIFDIPVTAAQGYTWTLRGEPSEPA